MAPSLRNALLLPVLALASLSPACSRLDVRADVTLADRKGWVLLPIQNLGETPMAGERVEELLGSLLRSQKGIDALPYPSLSRPIATASAPVPAEPAPELDERDRYDRSLAWARTQKLHYGIGGSVSEWRYRAASDGEAAVALTLRVVDLTSGKVVYTASGATSGWGRETVAGTAQRLLRSMLARLPVADGN